MANLEFCDTHYMVAYLKKIEGSEGFHQIVDFLITSHIQYALTENLTIYVSLIQKFWQTATVSTLDNREMEITAIIDGKVKTVSEASIRRHLKLEDSDGISNLPTTEIFEQLALMGLAADKEILWYCFYKAYQKDLEDPSKQGRKIAKIDEDPNISLVQHDLLAGALDQPKHKVKLIIEEVETILTKTKFQLNKKELVREEATEEKVKDNFQSVALEDLKEMQKKNLFKKVQRNNRLEKAQNQLKNQRIKKKKNFISNSLMICLKHLTEKLEVKLWIYSKEKFTITETNRRQRKEKYGLKLKRLFNQIQMNEFVQLKKHIHDNLTWKLYDSCGVYHVSTEDGIDIYMLVKKEYPLSRRTLTYCWFKLQDLKRWEELIRENVFGLGGHQDHLPAFLAHILYCILAEQQYNLVYFFVKRIESARVSPKAHIPYGDDDEDEGASRASTPSLTTYLNSLKPLDYQQYNIPTSSKQDDDQNDDLLFERQTDLLNQTQQMHKELRGVFKSFGKALRGVFGKKKSGDVV
ncbi:hypothetical protein Tco_1114176 [Tanacetum coccineum]|uniref:Uncharacterized protein n=1 Tax=Tanacetum coccineum TaxID=301880 RepID=A0ABQ5IWY4_9ASTR